MSVGEDKRGVPGASSHAPDSQADMFLNFPFALGKSTGKARNVQGEEI